MKRVHYYSSDDDRLSAYVEQISASGDRVNDMFYYFIIICIRMRQNRDRLSPR